MLLILTVWRSDGHLDSATTDKDRLRQDIQKSFHDGYQAAIKDSLRKNDDSIEKRYDVATLNQAARNRNSLLSSFGGDPYGMGSTMLSRQHVTYGRKRRALGNILHEAYSSGYAAGKEVLAKMDKEKQDPEKRFSIERLNQAARHRNVYFDAAGGDPYGGSSVVSSRQHVNWNHGKRSILSTEDNQPKTKGIRRLLRRLVKMTRKRRT